MRELKTILFFLFLFLSEVFPQQAYKLNLQLKEDTLPFGLTALVPKNKPVISLALSGGGARGLSQIGVLKALKEAGIKPDLIVGTSMGSIVGGLFSAGTSISELDSIAKTTDWQDLLTLINQSGRSDLFIDQKVTEDRAILTLRLDGLNPVLPTSFNDGQKLANYLNILVFNAPVHANESFDNFPIKFRAVCTDLVHGTPVVLDKGSLSNALRASSSVTFFLAPVKMDSLILVDGGLVANIPVDIAYKSGADFVLAVNTTSPLWEQSELNAPWTIADQIVSIPIKQANSIQLQNADYLLTPELNNWLSTDFDKVDSLISAGYNFTKDRVEEIKSGINDEIYNSLPEAESYFKNIVLDDSLTDVEKKIFSEYEYKDSVSNRRINADLYRLYDTGIYKNISANIVSEGDKNILKIEREENSVIKDISLIGVSLIQSDKISEIFSSIKDRPFYAKNIIENLIELISLYRKQGYSLAEIQSVEFNEEEKRLRVFVDEGIISRINVVGNEKTIKRVILREFPFREGDYFKLNQVEQGLTNLRSTKLFENIDVYVMEQNGQNVMEISVTEKPSGFLRLGFRLDNEYKFQVGMDIREENLFGTGAELGLILFGGSRNRAFILEQKSNRLFNSYLTYKINAYYKFNDVYTFKEIQTNNGDNFEKDVAGEYRQIFYGFSLGVGTQIRKFGNLIFEGRYGFDEVKNIRENTITPYKTKIVSLRISTTVDTQDQYPFPQKGVYFYGFYETALSVLGGELGYSNLGFDVKGYIPLAKRHILSPRAQIGFADKTLPLGQQYALGGIETFFGMRDYEYRGRQIFLTSLMYRYKLPVILFFETYLKFRYDLGSTWEVQEQIRFKDLKHGIGGSIAFDTPIGPAEFAAGRSFLFRNDLLNNPISWGEWKFYFSIGYYY